MADTWTWATVTQASPLRIKVDGDTSALDATTDDLVGSLAVSDRVRVHLHADGIIVTGLQGGNDKVYMISHPESDPSDAYPAGITMSDTSAGGWPSPYATVVTTAVSGNRTSQVVYEKDGAERQWWRTGLGTTWTAWKEVSTVGQLIPIGGGITWWGASDPASPGGGIEYAIPDGRALSRSTYSVLFALWGATFGAGDGTTTFNMPNAKGRVQVGRDSADSDFNTMGETRGTKTHAHTLSANGWAYVRAFATSGDLGFDVVQLSASYTYPLRLAANTVAETSLASSWATKLGGSTDTGSSIQPSIVANTAIRIK